MADVPSQDELELLLAGFPRLGELAQLPLWALVAYAARCARRVQPFFTLPDDHPEKQTHMAAVEGAIRTAEDFARGIPVADADTWGSGPMHAAYAAGGPNAAAYAAYAAYETTKATLFATKLDKSDRARADCLSDDPMTGEPILWPEGTRDNEAWVAWNAWSAAANSAAAARPADPAAASRSDFSQLRGLGLGRFPEPGEPIDPSEDGPLGPLWPEETRGA
jgi:hypothetical protein